MRVLLILIFIFSLSPIYAQDIEAFGKKENYGINGRMNVGYNHFSSYGQRARYAPHGVMITGGLQARLGAVEIPMSFTYSRLGGSITAPFHMIGASPYYKWIKLHLGQRSLNFSPLIFSGRTFNGVGLELSPGKYNLTAFTGSMQNLSVIRDTVGVGALVLPSYKRKIKGAKVGFQNKGNRFEIMGVRVLDETTFNDDLIPVFPLENLVLGANLNFRILKKINLGFHAGTSLFTADKNAVTPEDLPEVLSKLNPFYTLNISSRASYALESSLRYNHKGFFVGFRYRRLDPYYVSLATNFLQNDIENITLDFGLPLLSRKLNIRGSLGRQRDNLRNQKAFTNKRWIGSATATFSPTRTFQAVARYSNFQQESQSGLVEVNDTFKILTTIHNTFLNVNWGIMDDDVKGLNFSFNIFNNQFIDEAAKSFRQQDNNFSGLGANGRLTYSYKPKEISAGLLFNYNLFEFATYNQGRVGAGIHVNKSFLDKKINSGLQLMRQQNLYDRKGNGYLTNISMNTRIAITEKHSLSLRIMYRNNKAISTTSFSELRANMMYAYRF